ncbi:MAG: lysylphosphatidylglycerol synthase transmembrane domain-containing protein [Nitrospirota bacterium]
MRLKFWIGIVISAGLLALMFWWIGFDFRRLWDAAKGIDPWYLSAAVAINLAIYIVRALRWRYLMAPVKERVKLSHLYSATMVGFMANDILPARLGEIVRAYVIGRRENVSKSSAFATIVVERVFDSLSVFVLLLIVLAFMPQTISGGHLAAVIRRTRTISLIGGIFLIVVLAALISRRESLANIAGSILRRVSPRLAARATGLIDKFVHGLSVIKKPRLLVPIILLSAVHWGVLWIPVYIIFKGYGLDLGVWASAFTFVVIAFAVALPSTPGFIGTFQAAVAAALTLLGVQKEKAVAISIVMWAMGYIPVVIVGLFCLSREHLTLSSLKSAESLRGMK